MPASNEGQRSERGGRLRDLGRARVERLQRGAPVLDRLPDPRAALLGARRARPRRPAAPRPGRHARAGRGGLPFRVPSSQPRAPLAGGAGLDPAARALARDPAAAGRPGRVPVLHRRPLGLDLLPPAHRRPVDERPALLAPRAHQLGPHQRQRAGAGAEVRDDHQRGQPAGRGRRPGVRGRDRGGRRPRGGHGHAGLALVRPHAPAALPRAHARKPRSGPRSPAACT